MSALDSVLRYLADRLVIGANLIPEVTAKLDLGSAAGKFKNIYISGNVIGGTTVPDHDHSGDTGDGKAIAPAALNVGSATGATAGQVKASASIAPSNQALMGYQAKAHVTLANDGTAQLGLSAKPAGHVFLLDANTGYTGIYGLHGGGNTVDEISDPNGLFTPTAGTASKVNIYYNVGLSRYDIENKTGIADTIYCHFLTDL
jgi:hypothetical protein